MSNSTPAGHRRDTCTPDTPQVLRVLEVEVPTDFGVCLSCGQKIDLRVFDGKPFIILEPQHLSAKSELERAMAGDSTPV